MARTDKESVYDAAQRWVQAALRSDDSLFTPGRSIWTLGVIDEFHQRFPGQPDDSNDGFMVKFQRQLAGARAETIQLAAEILYVYYLTPSREAIGGDNKRTNIKKILGWADLDIQIPEDLDRALDDGIANPGTFFQTNRHAQLQLLEDFAQNWKQLDVARRTRALDNDPWDFKKIVFSLDVKRAYPQQAALLHLVHPDTFEPIVSQSHKDRIAKAFANRLDEASDDIDRNLLQIRRSLAKTHGNDLHFYDDDLRSQWDPEHSPDTSKWGQFIHWALRFVRHPEFDRRERDYKLKIANNLGQARSAIKDEADDWLNALQKSLRPASTSPNRSVEERVRVTAQLYREEQQRLTALGRRQKAKEYASRASLLEATIAPMEATGTFRPAAHGRWQCRVYSQRLGRQIGATADTREEAYDLAHKRRAALEADTMEGETYPDKNLVHFIVVDPFLLWSEDYSSEARSALLEMWSEQRDIEDAVRGFLHRVPADVVREPGARANLASFLAMAIDPCRYPPYRVAPFTTGYKLTGHPPPGEGADEAAAYCHALGFLDALSDEASKRGLKLRDRLDAESVLWSMIASSDWYKEVLPDDEHEAFADFLKQGLEVDAGEHLEPPPKTLQDIARALLWDVGHLKEIEWLLDDKRQVVFYGPPGTGKTFVAQKLARYFAGTELRTALVQFHPSYAYEDFIEGFRPTEAGGFSLREGPLKRIAQEARDAPEGQHVLVIDEINRGNLAKVFGELYFLLEYRNSQISLQYSDDQFKLPENLWVIATMNTADRSIALVDAALRRRFYFVPFFPDEPPVKGLLDRWLRAKEKPEMLWVAEVVDAANRILDELDKRDMAIGPSHFMRDDLDDEWVKRIWKHSILPYVEEQLFGETERVKEFELDTLRGKVEPPAGGEPAGASEPQGD